MEDKKPYTEQHDINNESNTENKDNSSNGMIIGLCIGLSAGITFGLLNDSIIMGVLLGIGIGLCFGTVLDFGKKGTNNKDDKERGEKMSKVKIDVNNLDKYFKKGELIPAIAYEVDTKTVLMLAYMNKESLKKTLETGYTWYYSRSRQELWNKGATSGHLQKVVSIYSDCDDDTLLLNVRQTGVACHTGSYSCFFNEMYNEEDN